MNAINVRDVFCSFFTVIQLLLRHSTAVLPCKQQLITTCKHVLLNDSICTLYKTPTSLASES